MCGIAGLLRRGSSGSAAELTATAGAMAAAIAHRGPDDHGIWTDAEAGIALAHRRLSIIDLSPAGHQPMASACGRYILTFNGEIYNAPALRTRLDAEGHAPSWRGHSDTEVLLAAIAAWGLRAALVESVGMFALGLWDRQTRTLSLARDRLGEKPLYYGVIDGAGVFAFASELSALRALPGARFEIDRDALARFMRHNYVPAPGSIYHGIHKLPPGTVLTLPTAASALPEPEPYWSALDATLAGAAAPFEGSRQEAVDEIGHLITTALRGQMMSDVPLGAFLSGGIDSSTVVALMQRASASQVRTFSIGFDDPALNEAPHAATVARHLGTTHHEMIVTGADALAVVPDLPRIYAEPFADASQIPTALLCRLARSQITVALSGDGGDELFCGYTRYAQLARLERTLGRIPRLAQILGSRLIEATPQALIDTLAAGPKRLLPGRYHHIGVGDKLKKAAHLLGHGTSAERYRALISHWPEPHRLVLGAAAEPTPPTIPHLDPRRAAMLTDSRGYLPDDILVKVDRASMAVGLEVRVPLLDHRLFEFAARLPLDLLTHDGKGKWPLREVLTHHVPQALVERPKMGFGVPLADWLRGPLRDWAESLLAPSRLRDAGLLDPVPIRAAWADHLSGRRDFHYRLWNVLMFEAWRQDQR